MIENSGFLSDKEEFTHISTSFNEVEIIGCSATNIYGRANRFGKRWFFKGVRPDAPDVSGVHQRLLKEFDIQISLVHSSVARAVSFENVEGVGDCIITEWIEGKSLADVIDESSLARTDRARIFNEIVEAVSYLHSQGIVHRDLKPDNILIRKNGQSAVVIDFGLADTDTHLYQKLPAGTKGYASQRQHIAHTPFTGDDIHALGVIMKQLCPELSVIAHRCREGRYDTAQALRTAIRHRNRRRRITWWISASFILLIVFVYLFIYTISLQNKTATLQGDVDAMTDSITSLRSSSEMTNTILRDSLTTVNQHLENERAIRLNREQRQSQINELKNKLNLRLNQTFANFRKTENPSDSNNNSIIRLIDRLTRAKTDFFSKEVTFTLSESELNELEYSFVAHYNKILQEWDRTLSQHRPNNSID